MTQKAIATFGVPAPASLLQLVELPSLLEQVGRIHDALARRAFEIFEEEGRMFGRDLDHWLRAEKEVLFPVPIRMEESEHDLIAYAEVPGFRVNELKVSLEPRKLTITGKKLLHKVPQGKKGGEEIGSREMLKIIDLPVEVDVTATVATLREGMLELRMPKLKVVSSTVKINAA